MRYAFIGLLTLLLSSCASIYQPIPEGYTGETAIVKDSSSNLTSTNAHYFILLKIDDKYIEHSWGKTRQENYGRGMRFTQHIVMRDVLPKSQKFTIQGLVFFPTDAQAIFGDEMSVTKEFMFTPVAGEKYMVKGELDKKSSTVWLEDSKGNIVENSKGMGK